MSFSFSVKGATVPEVVEKVKSEMEQVVVGQPSHQADSEAVATAANAYASILRTPLENEVIVLSISGSLSWREENAFVGASIYIDGYIGAKL
jgi:hypothetical protein